MLKFGKLSSLEKFKTKFYRLNIIVKRAVMHEMKKINWEILDSKFEAYDSCQRGNSVSDNISGDLIKLYNSSIKIDVNKSRKSFT